MSEYITIDNLNLDTPAWKILDLSELNDAPANRGNSILIPRRPGAIFRNKIRDSKIVNLPIIIYGDKRPDGTSYANAREGLLTNLDLLKKGLYNPYQPNDISRLLTYYRPTGNLEAEIQTSPKLNYDEISPFVARGVIEIEIASGALRSTTSSTINQWVDDDTTFNIGVDGSGEVYAVTYTIPGEANSLIINNLTTGIGLEYPDPITSSGLIINTLTYSATDNTNQVGGKIITSGSPFWLPLIPGTNQLQVLRDGGASVAMSIVYKAVYL